MHAGLLSVLALHLLPQVVAVQRNAASTLAQKLLSVQNQSMLDNDACLQPTHGGQSCVNLLLLLRRQGKFAHAADFTLRCGGQPSSGPYQTPVVALACNFEQSSAGALSFQSATTLFHEFGHALHSLLSRTKYQHLSG